MTLMALLGFMEECVAGVGTWVRLTLGRAYWGGGRRNGAHAHSSREVRGGALALTVALYKVVGPSINDSLRGLRPQQLKECVAAPPHTPRLCRGSAANGV